MREFTDSPYEKIMMETPRSRRPIESSVSFSKESPCNGCTYGLASPCIGFCTKKLLKIRKVDSDGTGINKI